MTTYNHARAILGSDFISAEEISTHFQLVYSKSQLDMFAGTLPGEDTLFWLRDNGYALIAGPPKVMCLLKIRDLGLKYFFPSQPGKVPWFSLENQKFSRQDHVQSCWLAIRKGVVPASAELDFCDQVKLLAKYERVPNAGQTAWGITACRAVHSNHLFPSGVCNCAFGFAMYARTSSVSENGNRVIASCHKLGLDIDVESDDMAIDFIGLSSIRLLDPS